MDRLSKIFIMLSLSSAILISQINHPYPPLDLVSVPTAGTLPRGSFTLETLLMKNGGTHKMNHKITSQLREPT